MTTSNSHTSEFDWELNNFESARRENSSCFGGL